MRSAVYTGVNEMKKWLILMGTIALIFIGGYLALSFYAVKFIKTQLQSLMVPGLTVAEIKIKPTCLSAKGIEYQDPHSKRRIFQIEEMSIYPDISASLKGSLRIRDWAIHQPSFFFSRSPEGVFVGPWVGKEKGDKEREISQRGEEKRGEPIHIRIDRIRIEKGSIDFEDMKPEGTPANLRLRDFDLEIDNIRFPFISSHSPIQFQGKTKGKAKDGKIHVKGNMDNPQFNLQETFFTRIAISLAEALGIPIKVVGGDVVKDTGKGAEGLMEGVKSLEELFKRKKEERR